MPQSYFAGVPPSPPDTPAVTNYLLVGQTKPGLSPTNTTAYRQYLPSDFSYHLFYSSLYTKACTLNILFTYYPESISTQIFTKTRSCHIPTKQQISLPLNQRWYKQKSHV